MIWMVFKVTHDLMMVFFTWIRMSESRMRNLSLFFSSAVRIVTRNVLYKLSGYLNRDLCQEMIKT